MNKCIFCQRENVTILLENEKAICFFDKYPVTKGHILIIPKRHTLTYFDLTATEREAMDSLLFEAKAYLDDAMHPEGYNIGLNCGEVSGQTIFHCHLHLIPRYKGDMEDPTGGVRGVIPSKQKYR